MECEDSPARVVGASRRGGLVIGQVYRVANCHLAIIQNHRL